MSEGLRDCPFCGGEAHITSDGSEYEAPLYFWVSCNKCNSRSEKFNEFKNEDSIKKAIKAWNTRADNTTLIEKLEGMKKKFIKRNHSGAFVENIGYNQAIQDVIDLIKGYGDGN